MKKRMLTLMALGLLAHTAAWAQADEAREHHGMHRDVDRMVVGVLVGALEPAQPQQRAPMEPPIDFDDDIPF